MEKHHVETGTSMQLSWMLKNVDPTDHLFESMVMTPSKRIMLAKPRIQLNAATMNIVEEKKVNLAAIVSLMSRN